MKTFLFPPEVTPAVSVVVIGRNEGPRLEACLRSIRAANWPVSMELIYADSGSNDGSMLLAAAYCALTCTIDAPFSAAAARNAGLSLARGEHVLFLDGDTILEPDFPTLALQALAETGEHAACVWGHRRESDPRQSVYTRVLDLDWIFPAGDSLFCGGDALFRRDALTEVGGFDSSLIAGEEPELCRRLRARGWTICHIDAPMTRHDLGIRRFAQYWRRCERAGHAYASVSKRFANSADPLWETESRRNVVHASILIALLLMPIPVALLAGLYAAVQTALACSVLLVVLIYRSACRYKWKATTTTDALLYGVHSHLQQLPVLCGQIRFWRRPLDGKPRKLIEYR